MRHYSPPRHASTAGLSLIELMVAMVIGLLLLSGLVQVMTGSRAAYQLSAGIARTQENARFAMDYLQRDLRMAGHMGCVNDQSRMQTAGEGINLLFLTQAQRTADNYPAAPFAGRFDVGVQGFEANGTAPNSTVNLPAGPPAAAAGADSWTPSIPAEVLALGPVAGSDIIVIRYFSPVGAAISSFSSTGGTTSTVTPNAALMEVTTGPGATGLFGLSDCAHASVFAGAVDAGTGTVTVSSGSGLNKSNFTGEETYQPGQSVLYRAETIVYYVGVGTDPNNPALYRARFGANGGAVNVVDEELVQGVESLQLLYGRDRNPVGTRPSGFIAETDTAGVIGGPATTPSNAQAADWRRVGSVQVGLLMRSNERASAAQADSNPSVLDVQMNAGNDGYYRSVYENTVALRNRLFGN